MATKKKTTKKKTVKKNDVSILAGTKIQEKRDVINAYSAEKKAQPHQTTMYVIVDYSRIEDDIEDILPHVFETSVDSIRHTTTGTDRVILKWKPLDHGAAGVPVGIITHIAGILPNLDCFTYDEILEEVKKPEWQSEDLPL